MIDERLLDDVDALGRVDARDALLALASAGARVRTSLRAAEEAGLSGLRPEGRPRAVLIAGHGSAATAGDVVEAFCDNVCQVAVLRPGSGEDAGPEWTLPGWAGPSDLLVAVATDGEVPGLVRLVERAYGRGCSLVVIAPPHSHLGQAALQVRALPLPYVPAAETDERRPLHEDADLPREDPGDFWGVLTPLLALALRLGLVTGGPQTLQGVADRLDEAAVRCRPSAAAYDNPAKTLAVQLGASLPLLWSNGPCGTATAGRFAAMLADHAGRAALTGVLPEAMAAQRGLFTGTLGAGSADPDDFFRDRVEDDAGLRIHVLLLRHRPGAPEEDGTHDVIAEPPADHLPDSDSVGTRRTVARARRLAADHQVALRELVSVRADPVEALAELVALTDFAAVYLGLAAERT
ncbi:SIS domain-containing protein [Streptacidiphilus jiangxiensis]|uniref:Phospho-glucose isomerase C-terminal SIS domain-containing protein n=1 Tax=Streptacidiphilus jiangxiensis TaxID=235985 RepID=A0A1H7YTI4_STRJI|nr:SIS domain-containing protein [Streptacidiphilus jiangxiensis]SEM49211.1 phospho-glucose isomerase C-terminal SIS domain-containing protein [Streptacidiphilus jiangxiensis]